MASCIAYRGATPSIRLPADGLRADQAPHPVGAGGWSERNDRRVASEREGLMRNIKEFSDDRQNDWCLHCARTLASLKTNKDHVPTKSLLRLPHPANLPLIQVCAECNGSFAKDEEYFVAFLSSAVSGTTDPSKQIHPVAARILEKQTSLRARIERAARRYTTHGGENRVLWEPEKGRIERVIIKNARGHAYYEFGEPMLEQPSRTWAVPLIAMSGEEREKFEAIPFNDGFPEVGSRMMTRVMTGEDLDGSWVCVQDGVYRYAVAQEGAILVRSIIFDFLATEVRWD